MSEVPLYVTPDVGWCQNHTVGLEGGIHQDLSQIGVLP